MSLALIKLQPSWQNTHVAIGDPLTLRLKHRVRKGDQLCPRHRAQYFLEIVPAHLTVRVEVSMQLPCRSGGNPAQLLQDSIASDSLGTRRGAESLRNTIGRSTKVTYATAGTTVGRVPKVMNQRLHAAVMALRIADDLFKLVLLL